VANPIPKESQESKLQRFRGFIQTDQHRSGSLGYKSHRVIAKGTSLSTATVSSYLKLHYPSVEFQMRKLRSRL
jgi:hypothetical protein